MSEAIFNYKEREKIKKKKPTRDDIDGYFHCPKCMQNYEAGSLGEGSPRDVLHYEPGTALYTYPDGVTARIITIWCKNCGELVWDSRHMEPMF